MRLEAHQGQHPDDVVRAAVNQARRWATRPETALLARAILSDRAPGRRDLTGGWVPRALNDWARTLTFYREPPPPGGPGEIVTSPPLTIALGGGDCDDIAAAVAALLASLGFEASIGRLYLSQDYGKAHILVSSSATWFPELGGDRVIIDPELEGPIAETAVAGVRWAPVGRLSRSVPSSTTTNQSNSRGFYHAGPLPSTHSGPYNPRSRRLFRAPSRFGQPWPRL